MSDAPQQQSKHLPGIIAFEDGSVFRGRGFGAATTSVGEAVFNTSMTGYQEILTDPSYFGQIVTMTAPQIGNYGINPEDVESDKPKVAGFVVRDLSPVSSNWRSRQSLPEYLSQNGVPGVSRVDTRSIAKKLRVSGALKACISTEAISDDEAIRRAREWSGMVGMDYVKDVTTRDVFEWDPSGELSIPFTVEGTHLHRKMLERPRKRIVAYDFGAKYNILRKLKAHGFDVTVVPADFPAAEVRKLNPEGVFLSNGPGDPAAVHYAHDNVRDLMGDYPMFGICLGTQIITHALGAKTFKLKFGHRGANHPIKNLESGRVFITSQNHGFASEQKDLEDKNAVVTELNLNDMTVAGLRVKGKPVFSVQYHPEASPGPHDSDPLFDTFYDAIEESKR